MQFKKLASATLLAVLLGGTVQAVQAQSISDVVRGLINRNDPYYGNGYYGGYGGYGGYSGYPGYYPNNAYFSGNDKRASNQGMIENNLMTGFANYQQQIAAGTAAGQFTPSEQAQLQSELNRLNAMRASFAPGGFSNNEVQQMLGEFNRMNSLIQSFQSSNNYW